MENEDAELEMIRQRRLQELQSQYKGGTGEDKEQAELKRQQMEEMRRSMLTQILTPDARERLARIALVKPEKARSVEDSLIRAAQIGQLGSKVDEKRLISLLEQMSESKKETKIKIQRRRYSDDED